MSNPKMKVLHTSDWHLGRSLYDKKRYEEFAAFLDWLVDTIRQNEVNVLLVAGDVFDTSTPGNRAQELYYRFLCRVAASPCRHVVITAGNHDSPLFLDAPRELLKALDVHVVGSASTTVKAIEEEVLVLRNGQTPELIVCAAPYLRDRDIRVAEAGESVKDKERKLVEGIRNHYAALAALAERKRRELGCDIPIVAMGHLYAAGGQTADGDGVRDLYVGSLIQITAETFPACFDYSALGHLHVPQKVNGSETIRYSGSPLPMGFGEAEQRKSVCLVEFNTTSDIESHAESHRTAASVQLIDVPVFQELKRVKGNWEEISRRISELSATGSCAWLEVAYEGDEVIGDLNERLDEAVSGTQMEILRVMNHRVIDRMLGQAYSGETLDDLNENDVFTRCLDANDIPEQQRAELLRTYKEAILSLYENDEDDTQSGQRGRR